MGMNLAMTKTAMGLLLPVGMEETMGMDTQRRATTVATTIRIR